MGAMKSGREARLYELARQLSSRMDALRKESEPDSLKQAFRVFADSVPAIIWTARADGAVTYFNRHYYDFFGVTHERWIELIHPDDKESCMAAWSAAVSSGTPYEHSSRFLGADREYHQLVTRAQPVRDDGGTIAYWIGSSAVAEVVVRPALQVVA